VPATGPILGMSILDHDLPMMADIRKKFNMERSAARRFKSSPTLLNLGPP
jgi:hypothetical protein